MKTMRQQIISLLNVMKMTAIELSGNLKIPEKEVYDHLPHISSSIKSKGKRLVIQPAICLSCGYAFKTRTRFTSPGRCPHCKKSHIQNPAYYIRWCCEQPKIKIQRLLSSSMSAQAHENIQTLLRNATQKQTCPFCFSNPNRPFKGSVPISSSFLLTENGGHTPRQLIAVENCAI